MRTIEHIMRDLLIDIDPSGEMPVDTEASIDAALTEAFDLGVTVGRADAEKHTPCIGSWMDDAGKGVG